MKKIKETKNWLKCSASAACLIVLTGCAGVPMAPAESNLMAKSFPAPQQGKSGLYVYRDSFAGKALKKDVYLNDKCLGETADRVFFYTEVDADQTHKIGTESEFSANELLLQASAGENYFVRQYIKIGVFVGGAGLERVAEEEGKRVISKPEVNLAIQGKCGS